MFFPYLSRPLSVLIAQLPNRDISLKCVLLSQQCFIVQFHTLAAPDPKCNWGKTFVGNFTTWPPKQQFPRLAAVYAHNGWIWRHNLCYILVENDS